MEKVKIKQIADYLKDLEEGLYEWDSRGRTPSKKAVLKSQIGHLKYLIAKYEADVKPSAH